MIKLGHRGYSAKYPENTMEAFKQAYLAGFDGIETDVHMAKDGTLIICHDETINRTSNGKGYIKDMTLEELREYNYNYKFGGIHPIPTLRELLEYIKETQMLINIEIKTDEIHYENIEEEIVRLVDEIGVEDLVMYSSFYLPSVLKIKELVPSSYVAYLFSKNTKQKMKEVKENNILAIHPKYSKVNGRLMKEVKEHHIKTGIWTVLDSKELKRLEKLGVDMVISNERL